MNRTKQSMRISSVYVAVDFGTTYSGITFQKVKDGKGIGDSRQVRQWPSPGGYMDEAKVPSKLHYCLDAQGTYVVDAWGYQVQGDDDLTFEWIKLLLLNDEDSPEHLRCSPQIAKMKLRLRKIKKTAIEVISDYLTKLWRHAIDEEDFPPQGEICKSIGGLLLSIVPIHVILSVPAIWSEAAKAAMKQAATKSLIIGNVNRSAGLTTFEFVSEPEAAAHAYAKEILGTLDLGETILVCDLGGGTGDCISYQLTNRDSLELKEVVPGSGSICGGSILDEEFKKLCQDVLHSQNQPTTTDGWHALLRDGWEHNIKRSFVYTGNARPWRMALSTQTDNYVHFHEDQLRDVFNSSVVPAIIILLRGQIVKIKAKTGKPPTMILLVGGFGRCPFIRQALEKEFCKKKAKSKAACPPIEIMTDQGDMPWSAISRGAVEYALKPRVKTRIAQRSVGFQQSLPTTQEEGGVWDNNNYEYSVPDGMTWVVKKGEEVSSSSKILAEVLRLTDESQEYWDKEKKKHPQEIASFYAYDGEELPSRYGDGVGFQEIGEIAIQVPVKVADLPKLRDEDEEAIANPWIFKYDLHVNCSGASTEVTAVTTGSLASRRIKEGMNVGTLTMDVDEMELDKKEAK
ncbi:hypothetical protein N0V82_001195 [Gnomoniopsis sp. IMI 355080]|nr:hypothetical protein N0V82_001195 [Gnomoniopsis sp. IMI 355080]